MANKRNITYFITSQSVSLLGSMLVMYAIMWHITLTTKSGFMMTIYVLTTFLPALFISPFAGVWADRLNKKKVMITADLTIAIFTLLIAVLFLFNIRHLWIIFVISIIRTLGQAVHQPAVSSVYPVIVDKDYLLKVQGINQGIQSASMIVIPLLAGLLLSIAPIEYLFFIDVVTAVIAVWMLVKLIKIPKKDNFEEGTKIAYFKEIKEGIQYAYKKPLIYNIILFGLIFMMLVAAPSFLSYLQVTRVFGDEPGRLSVLEVFFGGGMLLGSFVISIWKGFKNRLVTYFVSYIMIGIGTIGLGIPINYWLYIGFWFVVGFFIALSSPLLATIIQEKVEEEYLGRVFSVFGLIHMIAMPIGMLVFGPLSDTVDASLLILISGIGMVAISMLVFLKRDFIKLGIK